MTIATTWLRSLRIDDWRRLAVSIDPSVPSPSSNSNLMFVLPFPKNLLHLILTDWTVKSR
ncbi:MAG: hypothetical protein WCF03_01555 [Nitrososphaeraceae archaeon]